MVATVTKVEFSKLGHVQIGIYADHSNARLSYVVDVEKINLDEVLAEAEQALKSDFISMENIQDGSAMDAAKLVNDGDIDFFAVLAIAKGLKWRVSDEHGDRTGYFRTKEEALRSANYDYLA